MPIFIINTLSTFRMKYAIEAETLEHALDELVMTEHDRHFDELTQKWLGEQIIDGHEVTSEQFEELHKQLSDDKTEMASYWLGDKVIHKVNYETTNSQ